jgi:hypothetical protein
MIPGLQLSDTAGIWTRISPPGATTGSLTPEDEKRERWWRRAAKAIAPAIRATYEKDWMGDANCLDDNRFITAPPRASWEPVGTLTDPALEKICKQCPVSMNCMEWADKHNPTGVFIAGEWRE